MEISCHYVAENCMGMWIRRAGRVVSAYYDDCLRPEGLKGTQFTLLNEIYLNPYITIGQLAVRLMVDRTTLNRNLNLLERKELVASGPGEDLRTRTLLVSQKGEKILKRALPLWQIAQRGVENHMGKRLYSLIADLHKLESLKS